MTQASANAATNITASFSYDQFGRRTNKTINGEAVNYVYDGDQAVGESSSTASTSQLTGVGIDEHIARYTGQDQLVYLTDALGSIIAQTKADGSFQNKYGYSPYGQVAKDADDKGNPHQFTGRENDNTVLMFYRARYYMPSCGRFISEDPIGTDDGLNVYAYVGGDPVNARDPTGNCGWTDAIVGFGDAFGAGLIRHLLGISDGDVDKNSGWYNGGMIGGTVWGAVPFALTGGAAVGATREGHLLNHNRYFRIGPGRIGKEMVPRVSSPYLSGRNGHYELATRLRPLPPLGGLLPKGEGDGPDCD